MHHDHDCINHLKEQHTLLHMPSTLHWSAQHVDCSMRSNTVEPLSNAQLVRREPLLTQTTAPIYPENLPLHFYPAC